VSDEKKTNQPRVHVNILNWGPFVLHFKISEAFHKLLLEGAEQARIADRDYRTRLAGHIREEYAYNDLNKYTPYIASMMRAYEQALREWRNTGKDEEYNKYFLKSMWVNYQKQNEFNPPHNHSDKYSFVTYLSIPEELKEENKNCVSTSTGPGSIMFTYGDGPKEYITYQSYFPEERDIFIFPASLTHYVCPFKSNCERVSVSGNILTDIPLHAAPPDMNISVVDGYGEKPTKIKT
tara:strand:+ start:134 stop:841 length:708 start_codon:yes stop_codon:yes gene_type:complete